MATVLGNLIQNGIDAAASSRPGTGRPGCRWRSGSPGDGANSSSATPGPGVDARIATEVFEHGFTTKAAQDGERGIGLALTRLICRRRGGEVEVSNTADGADSWPE